MKRAFLLVLMFSSTVTLQAERIALVMGNNKYDNLSESLQLQSPVADATDVAAALLKLGYKLVSDGPITDATREKMITAIEDFTTRAKNAEAAVFYFSGHGIQIGEDQFLIPRDTPPLTGYSVLTNRAVKLRESIMVALEEQQARTKVMILDCCRDNPFSAQLERALAQVGKSTRTKSLGEITGYGAGFYLAFATSPGTTANDGNGARNSPFTAAMLKAIPGSSGKDIDFFFRDVKSQLGQEQVSWTNHSLTDSFALAQGVAQTPIISSAGMSDLEKLKQEIEALKRQQGQVTDAPPATMSNVPASDSPPGPLPADLPASGFFERPELFATGPYSAYNTYSQTQILRRVQESLKKEGHYSGKADGIRGPGTQSALHAWQQAQGIRVSGRLDSLTVQKLGLSGIQQMTPPPPPAKTQSTITSTIQEIQARYEKEEGIPEKTTSNGSGWPYPLTGEPATSAPSLPVAKGVPGKPGFYYSPSTGKIIDARDLKPGAKGKDPQTGEIFRLPSSSSATPSSTQRQAPAGNAPPPSLPPAAPPVKREMTDEEFFQRAQMLRKQ